VAAAGLKIVLTQYLAFKLSPGAQMDVLQAFPPRFAEVRADHVTIAYGVSEDYPLAQKNVNWRTLTAIAYICDHSLEALIVAVDGDVKRPDGKFFHLTLSKASDRSSFESNAIAQERSKWKLIPALNLSGKIVFVSADN